MATSTTATTTQTLTFTRQETLSGRTKTDSTTVQTSTSLAAGTGTSQVNGAYQGNGTLTPTGSLELDLTSLSQTTFGAPQTISFNRLNSLIISNTSSSFESFRVAATGSAGLVELFNGSGNIPVPASSSFGYTNKQGITVDGTNKMVQLLDLGDGALYNVAIVGTTG